jgi:photosystem II stability/assembly factor-like uncharacterized protein
VLLLVGTRKGAFLFRSDGARKRWQVGGPHFLGQTVHHLVLDPRDGRTMLMAAKTGHLGPTIFRSTDDGKTWKEAGKPPAFRKVPEGMPGRSVDFTFFLSPGHASEPNHWYAGASPVGLFRTGDAGETWEEVVGFNDGLFPRVQEKVGPVPGGALTHSILVDPRNRAHLYVGLSSGGLFESVDKGANWRPLNKGVAADFLPEPNPEYGHDPHMVVLHPLKPDRLYQQNHCGIYRLDRPGEEWVRIGNNMPREVGDIGFPIVLHPRDPDTAWVFPMDGTTVWPRTSPGGRPAAYRTRNAGKTWERQDRGLPRAQGWFTVKRQAMAADGGKPVGLYFGTTGGEIWGSADEGRNWRPIAAHLPEIFSLAAAMP